MGFKKKVNQDVPVKVSLSDSFKFLLDNIALFSEQRSVDAVLSLHEQWKRKKTLTAQQAKLVQFLIVIAKRGGS